MQIHRARGALRGASQRGAPLNVSRPTASPWRRRDVREQQRRVRARGRSARASPSCARMRRPQSTRNTICWSRSSWYSRDDELAHARGRLPVDLAQRVALAIFAQLVEVEALAAPPPLQHADLRQAVVRGEQRELRQRGEVRVHARRRRLADAAADLPQAERRGEPQLDEPERRSVRARPGGRCSGSPPSRAPERSPRCGRPFDSTPRRVVVEHVARDRGRPARSRGAARHRARRRAGATRAAPVAPPADGSAAQRTRRPPRTRRAARLRRPRRRRTPGGSTRRARAPAAQRRARAVGERESARDLGVPARFWRFHLLEQRLQDRVASNDPRSRAPARA